MIEAHAIPALVPTWRQAAARRLSGRGLFTVLIILTALVLIGGLGLVSPVWGASSSVIAARLVETMTTGLVILLAIVVADIAVDRGVPPVASYLVAVLAGAWLGAYSGWELREALGLQFPQPPGGRINPTFAQTHRLELVVIGVLVGGMATFVHVARRTAVAARQRQHAAELGRSRARRRTLESQLQALQARVEPMFLFDTLARIGRLYESDPENAGAMLENLIAYLRAALPHMRESSASVAQELALVTSWLDIVDHCDTDGRVIIDADEVARGARLPALVLLPLIQHVVATADGDPVQLRIGVFVTNEPERLRLVVSTSSDAFAVRIVDIPILVQIERRLHALHNDRATFTTALRAVGKGSEAVIELPIERREENFGNEFVTVPVGGVS